MLHGIDVGFLTGQSRRHLVPAMKYIYILWKEAFGSVAAHENINSSPVSLHGERGVQPVAITMQRLFFFFFKEPFLRIYEALYDFDCDCQHYFRAVKTHRM